METVIKDAAMFSSNPTELIFAGYECDMVGILNNDDLYCSFDDISELKLTYSERNVVWIISLD